MLRMPIGRTFSRRSRRWHIDEGHKPGLSTDERKELVELRRKNRVLEMEIEILKRAAWAIRRPDSAMRRTIAIFPIGFSRNRADSTARRRNSGPFGAAIEDSSPRR